MQELAKEQLKTTVRELLKDPDSAKLLNVNAVIDNDSLCVLQFTLQAKNSFGGYVKTNYRYFYAKLDTTSTPVYGEALSEAKDYEIPGTSKAYIDIMMDEIADSVNGKKPYKDKPEVVKQKAMCLASMREIRTNGRRVQQNNQKGEDINL